MPILSLALRTDQPLDHAKPTLVRWSGTERADVKFWSAENPAQIKLAYDADVRIRLGASFATHAKGMRQAWVIKNGQQNESFFGYPTPTALAVGEGSSTSFSATSPLVRHKAGDIFEMYVYQTSGDKIALRGAHATWIEFEIIPVGA